jgi:hypothetical protein
MPSVKELLASEFHTGDLPGSPRVAPLVLLLLNKKRKKKGGRRRNMLVFVLLHVFVNL